MTLVDHEAKTILDALAGGPLQPADLNTQGIGNSTPWCRMGTRD